MKIKLLILTLIILIVALGTVFVFRQSASKYSRAREDNNDKVSIRLKWLNQAQFAGFYYADKSGYYENAHLDVAINPGGPDFSPIQTVASGGDDFGIVGADQLILAREKGIPVVAVAVIYRQSPVALASFKESGILTPKDLTDKTVGVVYGRDEELLYRLMLKRNFVDRSKIKEVPLKFDLSQLLTKQADSIIVYAMNEPVLLKLQGKEVTLIKPSDYNINLYADTLFTTEEMIKKKPDVVRRFVEASINGWAEALKNQTKAIDFTMKVNNQLNREHQAGFLKESTPFIQSGSKPVGLMGKSEWENMQNLLLEEGFLKQPIDLDLVFSNEFLPKDVGDKSP